MRKTRQIGYRPTWAEVNLNNLAYNFKQIKKKLSPKTKVMVCVKADAYGHGLVPVAKKLAAYGADFLGVASIDEGIKLREAQVSLPILILGLIFKEDIAPLFKYRLTPTVCDKELPLALNKMAGALKSPISLHIKVDTGMGRIGVLPDDAEELIRDIFLLKFIRIEGLFTHFPMADLDRRFTVYQVNLFNRLIARLNKDGIYIPLMHAANSIAVINYKESHFNLVRPGLVVYGLHPKKGLRVALKPVLSLKTKVIYIKKLPKGSGVSYGHDYVTKKATQIATLPIGYGDGYPRNLSNRAEVLIGGERFRISGRVCMDQIMVDIGEAKLKVGDEVVLIGSHGKNKITAEELARLSGTIPYEIVCGLGSRIPRLYI